MEQPKPTRDSEKIRSRYVQLTSDIKATGKGLENLVCPAYVADYKEKLSDCNEILTKLLKE